ncbi:MAG: hypothetical protein AT715_06250 [Thermoproteus sp. JCHS_4]|jgi:hypothetical protein|nr:MAG: hypothetical protein AT715_06250 [Thermoproteus sp. JCHS_4]
MRHAWIALALLAAVAAFAIYFMSTVETLPTAPSTTAAPTATTVQPTSAPPATQTAAQGTQPVTPQTSSTPREAQTTTSTPPAPAQPPFNASSYEVNYTIAFTVSTGNLSMRLSGWVVVAAGPKGNYSFGVLTASLPPHGAESAVVKSATEGNVTYTMTCYLDGGCRVDTEGGWPLAELVEGANVTRTAKGQCSRLGYAGVLYEERGELRPEAFRGILDEGWSGNYTAHVCEVAGVMLSADLTATAAPRGGAAAVTVELKMEAVKAAPFNHTAYEQILQEIKQTGNPS